MKNNIAIGIIATLVICLAIVCVAYINPGVNATSGEGNSTISVSGTGIIKTEPNQAKVYLGVETQSGNVTEALEENSLKMQSIIKAIKKLGIPKGSIETTYFSVYPIRDYEKSGEDIIGYRASNEITVELHDLDKIGTVIEEAMNAGANKVRRIEFGLTEDKKREVKNEALKEACKDARTKADAIASGLGLKITRIATARESGTYVAPYRAEVFGGEYAMPVPTPAPKAISPPIELKEVKVSATIDITYECR
ncbi:MAG: SIMPL domain-containing protein [Methanophagales archaeon]|nr:SIMPL domain-containing protein [Methanophagales archaeon]